MAKVPESDLTVKFSTEVERETFRQGAVDGWNKAWTEYYATLSSKSSLKADEAQIERKFTDSTSVTDEQQDEGEEFEEAKNPKESTQFQLSAEWAALFAQGAERRRLAREEEEKEALQQARIAAETEAEAPIALGAEHDAAQRARTEQLYGARAAEVLREEARLNASFQAASAALRAPLWPILPLEKWKSSFNPPQ